MTAAYEEEEMRGHLRRRGRESWAVVIDTAVGGKRRQKWLRIKARTKKQADAERIRILQALQTGMIADSRRLTLGALLQSWLEHKRSRILPRSLERYETIIRKYIDPAIGNRPLASLTPAHVDGFYGECLRHGSSASIVRYCHVTLHAALKYALRLELVPRNVCDAVLPPKPVKADVRSLTDLELAAILEAAHATPLEVGVYLGATCGLRRGEALALRWSCVDLAGGTLQVRESLEKRRGGVNFKLPKTDKSRRTVSIPPITVAILREHRTEQLKRRLELGTLYRDHNLVICRPDGAPVDPGAFSKAFSGLARSCGLAGAHFHSLRHTVASKMLQLGVPTKVVSEMLGHSSTMITQEIYQHTLPTMGRDAAQRFDAALRDLMAATGRGA